MPRSFITMTGSTASPLARTTPGNLNTIIDVYQGLPLPVVISSEARKVSLIHHHDRINSIAPGPNNARQPQHNHRRLPRPTPPRCHFERGPYCLARALPRQADEKYPQLWQERLLAWQEFTYIGFCEYFSSAHWTVPELTCTGLFEMTGEQRAHG